MSEQMDRARTALAAWQRGDVAALAAMFDPQVELLWWTPGPWDCHGKDDVVDLLTERAAVDASADVDVTELDDTTLLVSRTETAADGPQAGFQPATVVRFRNGLVVHMQQYRSRDDALAAVTTR